MRYPTSLSCLLVVALVTPSIQGFSCGLQKTAVRQSSVLYVAESNQEDSAEDSASWQESLRSKFGAEAVPEDQRPVNEYLDIISQPFFGWANLDAGETGLLTRLAIVYGVVFVSVCYPIAGATYTQDGYLLQKMTSSSIGASGLVLVLIFRIYSGWSYIGKRLQSKAIEFEETGWYDGDVEMKTKTEIMRDRMLYTSEVKPVVDRMKKFMLGAVGLCTASVLSFNVANSANPMFDKYDPAMLGRLVYDDKLADTAAERSGSRPTYCDSRYYRAVANGGQGC